MHDRSIFWSPPPEVGACLSGPDLTIRLLPPVPQIMISGDLDQALQGYDLPGTVGLMGQTHGPAYAVRLARNRMLVVGRETGPDTPAWQQGVAHSSMTGALAVLDISGPASMELVARGAAIDPATQSPSATLVFAGVTAVLYRHETAIRLHIDRGLLAYLFDWACATDLIPEPQDAS